MQGVEEKAAAFQALHREAQPFVLANAWDAGSARMLKTLGFAAIGTTSAGYAFSQGIKDGGLDRAAILANAEAIDAATALPVSADLLNGFGDTPETVAETVRLAGAAGLAGASIEDTTGDPAAPLYPIPLAAERIAAAMEAAASLGRPFVVTARADALFCPDVPEKTEEVMEDVFARLEAFAKAGADVLYAPGLTERSQVERAVSFGLPVNVLASFPGMKLTMEDYRALGVRRLSVGSSLFGAAMGAAAAVAKTIAEEGRFPVHPDQMGYVRLMGMMA